MLTEPSVGSAPQGGRVPSPPEQPADLIGWRIAMRSMAETHADHVEVLVRDAWERPGGAPAFVLEPQPAEEPLHLAPALTCELSWAAQGGRQRLAGTLVEERDPESWELHAEWPPQMVQERRYHRGAIEMDVWVVTLDGTQECIAARTLDLSAGGVALAAPAGLSFGEGEHLAVAIQMPDRPIMATATVIEARDGRVRASFEQITTADQDRLMRLIHQVDKGW